MNEAKLYADNFGAAFFEEYGFLHFLKERTDGGCVERTCKQVQKSPAICISLHSTRNPKKAVITSTNAYGHHPHDVKPLYYAAPESDLHSDYQSEEKGNHRRSEEGTLYSHQQERH